MIRFSDERPRLAVLASKAPHCLVDILSRWHAGELDAEIAVVASNHPEHRDLCGFFGVDFEYLPVGEDREVDDGGAAEIWVEQPPDTPAWEGVADRLRRAASAVPPVSDGMPLLPC